MQNKRLTLNAEKRKTIENVFQSHWEREDSPVVREWQDAKNTYDTMKPKVYELVNNVVRSHQPQEDVDTIRSMIKNMIGLVGNCTMIIVSSLECQL